jgi:hypothetical protein
MCCADMGRLDPHNRQPGDIGGMLVPDVVVQVLLPLEGPLTAFHGTLDQIGAWPELTDTGGLTALVVGRVG